MRFRHSVWAKTVIAGFAALVSSCEQGGEGVAPYAGTNRPIANLSIQDSTFSPRIAWTGGYVTAIGVNRGSTAILDSTLVWLAHGAGNTLSFPITFGSAPPGIQDLTSQYGGQKADSLSEDESYTFWILEQDVWSVISTTPGKPIKLDSLLTSSAELRSDTFFVSPQSHTQRTLNLDVFVNIRNVLPRGRLALLDVQKTEGDNNIRVSYTIIEAGVTDTAVAAVGLVEGSSYSVSLVVWEVLSTEIVGDSTLYWTRNTIRSPFNVGQVLPETDTFVEFPPRGLERNRTYYLWIANKNWDQRNRFRSTSGYAFLTFETW